MSNTWTIHLRIEEVYDTEGANHPLRLQKTEDPYDPHATVNFFARNNNSDISGYKTLEKQNGDGFVELTKTVNADSDTTVLIEEFATNDKNVAGHTSEGSTTFVYSVWWSKGAFAPNAIAQAKCEFYHRDDLGYETLIGEFSRTVNTTETRYTTIVNINEIFEPNERFIVKWYGDFQIQSGF